MMLAKFFLRDILETSWDDVNKKHLTFEMLFELAMLDPLLQDIDREVYMKNE